jgi:NCS1 family nucleobase:cation symporter-1
MQIKNPSPSLYNEDLAPATERKWGAFSIFNVWTSDVHSLWGYYLAASLFLLCGNFINFVLAIGLGSLVIYFLMTLVGNAGVRTGVPYPVLARASFGTFGANVPALVRAIVACFWYGAQTARPHRGPSWRCWCAAPACWPFTRTAICWAIRRWK